MFELWTAATPNGWKISIMWEELKGLGIALPDLKVQTVDIGSGEQFSERFTAINPNQKIPALIHGNQCLMESCAILQFLAETYPSSLLPLSEQKWDVLQWVYWQAANLGPNFGNKLSYTRYMDDVDPNLKSHPLARFNKESLRLISVLSNQLADKPYICGSEFTIADIASYPWIRGWKWSKVDITSHQNIVDWLKRVRARPGVDRGLKYGIPKDEVDTWSSETRKRYAKMGASMASNDKLRTVQ
jgi:GST-like protein